MPPVHCVEPTRITAAALTYSARRAQSRTLAGTQSRWPRRGCRRAQNTWEVALGLEVAGDDQPFEDMVIFHSPHILVAHPHAIQALSKRPRAAPCAGISDRAIRAVTENTVNRRAQVGEYGCWHCFRTNYESITPVATIGDYGNRCA